MAKDEGKKGSGIGGFFTFLSEARDELKKVHTPTRQETVQATLVVMMMIVMFGLFLGFTDLLVGSFMQWILTS